MWYYNDYTQSRTGNFAIDERAFSLQVNGTVPQLDFVGRIQEVALPSVHLDNLMITEIEEHALLTVDLHLYTSPFALGAVMPDSTALDEETAVPQTQLP